MKEPPYKYMVRLPPSMGNLIRESARHYRRSMNSDIVARLQHSFSGLTTGPAIQDAAVTFQADFEAIFHRDLNADEENLIQHYRRLPSAKREALLKLLV